jgi:hypothetical protein
MARATTTDAAPDRSAGSYDRDLVRRWRDALEAHDWTARPARVARLVEAPRSGQREERDEVTVVAGQGFAGDYERKDYYKGERQPGREVSAVALEVAQAVGADPVAIGDNLVTEGVDLRALEDGDRLLVGEEVVLRRSADPHRPCVPFRERTSPEAFATVAQGGFRGALFYAEEGGCIRAGAPIRVVPKGAQRAKSE